MKKRSKAIICVFLSICIIATLFTGCNKTKTIKEEKVMFYGFNEKISLEKYLPLTKANALLKENNGIAVANNGVYVYVNGDYVSLETKNVDGTLLVTKGTHDLTINGELFKQATGIDIGSGEVTPEEAAEKLGLKAIIHDEKCVVFLPEDTEINAFDNFYVFEMISLKLREAPLEDFENAFLELPATTENGSNLINVYTDADLDLGLSTDMYDAQGVNLNSETTKITPRIVAGEGENEVNHTLIRVYNEYQAKTSQFLAFPANVTGGVNVKAAYVDYNGENRGVIVAAAYDVTEKEAGYVKVFDEYGILYMTIKPDFDGPFNIVTGNFYGTDSHEQLLITTSVVGSDGTISYELYDLSNGNILKQGTKFVDSASSGHEITESLFNNGVSDFVILYDESTKATYTTTLNDDEQVVTLTLSQDSNANGIYQSAFGEKAFIATIELTEENPNQSFVKLFSSENDVGTVIDTGKYENTFFWNYSGTISKLNKLNEEDFEDTEYFKQAGFQHVRVDLASKVMSSITKVTKVDVMKEYEYSKWTSKHNFKTYLTSLNVWEPCFTHRFNKTSGICVIAKYTDADGYYKFLGYTKENQTADYLELDSSFYNGTYAEGILFLDKMRIYNLRDYLQELHNYFVQMPENLVGLEPIHEIEINCGDSVGDYNPNNIEGFRSYLFERYGTLENINKRFGTTFSSREEIDAPRDGALGDRGDWDKYEGKYFEEWCIFTRKMVNKRLTESFREAALAGFPSEIISSHSIPEGDAITGLLGQADTRMSPVDAIMTLGFNFGSTRYGLWFQSETNFLALARNAGFKNITMGEYNTWEQAGIDEALAQIRYIWSHGSKFINILSVSDVGSRVDLLGVKTLISENEPRPGSAQGTTSSLAVNTGVTTYQIVELGGTDSDNGLLKSINSEGTWTGDIYLSPFHANVSVESFSLKDNFGIENSSPEYTGLQTGDVVEINFIGKYEGVGSCTLYIDVYEDGVLCENYSKSFEISQDTNEYKYTLYNDVPLGTMTFKSRVVCEQEQNISVLSFEGYVEREEVARKYYSDYSATEHVGGVSFDILSREMLYGN